MPRRLLAWATIYDGGTRGEAVKAGGVTRQIVRDWVLKFNTHGPVGLIDRKAPGQPSRLDATHRAALVGQIESGPSAAIHGVVRSRVIDLCQWLFEEYKVRVAKRTLSRELRKMGYRTLSARPRHHAQAEDAIDAVEKVSQPIRPELDRRTRSPGVGDGAAPDLWSTRSVDRLDLHFRRDRPARRRGRGTDPAMVQHRGDDPASRRGCHRRGAWSSCGSSGRPSQVHLSSKLVIPPNITLVALPPG